MFDTDFATNRPPRSPIPTSDLDRALTAQFVVAWAGEGGEEKRLGWWRSDLVSEFGGRDLFRRLLPNTSEWAVLQAAREAARRTDAELRARDHDADRLLSLFSLGFELDERIEERLLDLKQAGQTPYVALPGLADGVEIAWNRDRFQDWVRGHGDLETTAMPVGRRISGIPPSDLAEVVRRLVGALAPLTDNYPLPHFRRAV